MPPSTAPQTTPRGARPTPTPPDTVDLPQIDRRRFTFSDASLRNAFLAVTLSVLLFVTIISIVTEHNLARLPSLHRVAFVQLSSACLEVAIGALAGLALHLLFRRLAVVVSIPLAFAIVYAATIFSMPGSRHHHPVWENVLVQVWRWAPFAMVLTTALLAAIPRRLFESAAIDRLPRWFIVRRIIVPLVWPTLLMSFLYLFAATLRDQFGSHTSWKHLLSPYAAITAALTMDYVVSRIAIRRRLMEAA